MTTSTSLNPTNLLAAASETLQSAGYEQISAISPEGDSSTSRLFEDPYNIVGVAVFATCSDLVANWPSVQGALVDTISRYISKGESKSWDGYLVLLTPGLAPSNADDIESIRYNTTRLRKLVATGDDLRSITDVERTLRPLLPIESKPNLVAPRSALDLLPKLLVAHGIPEAATRSLLDAFESQTPLLERLHDHRNAKS